MYSTIRTYHTLHSKNGNKIQIPQDMVNDNNWQNVLVQSSQTCSHGKYENNDGKYWYFRIDDNNKISYKHILLIT